jgi:hypothetical protein
MYDVQLPYMQRFGTVIKTNNFSQSQQVTGIGYRQSFMKLAHLIVCSKKKPKILQISEVVTKLITYEHMLILSLAASVVHVRTHIIVNYKRS